MKKLLYTLLLLPLGLFAQTIMSIEQDRPLNLVSGWNIIGFTCNEPIDVVDAFLPIVDKVIIAKDNYGGAYLPEFGFNGIGVFEYGYGYQLKLTESISNFQFCPFLVPIVDGCTDETAFNYNSSANLDDGSCQFTNCYYPPDPEFVNWLQDNTEGVMNANCLDIDAAANINELAEIYVSNCENIDGIQYFTNLQYLSIYGNEFLTSLPDISSLTNLQYLNIFGNEILTSLPELSGLINLQILSIEYCPALTSLPELSALMNLEILNISFNQGLTFLPNLSDLTNLHLLEIRYNSVLTSIGDLSNLYNLEFLNIEYNDAIECILAYPEQLTIHESWPPVCQTYQVGDLAEGGIIFYVDSTGQHGLVAAMEDLTEGATDPYGYGFNGYECGCFFENVSGADGQAIGIGYQNTMDIVSQGCVTENGGITAAQVALDAEVNGYSDWYLPSIDELNEMYNTIGPGGLESNIGGFEISVNSYYWSSSEINYMTAWGVYFDNGDVELSSKNNTRSVRVIRAF